MCGEERRRKKMQEGSRDKSGRIGGRRGGKKRMKERGWRWGEMEEERN